MTSFTNTQFRGIATWPTGMKLIFATVASPKFKCSAAIGAWPRKGRVAIWREVSHLRHLRLGLLGHPHTHGGGTPAGETHCSSKRQGAHVEDRHGDKTDEAVASTWVAASGYPHARVQLWTKRFQE